MCPMPLGNSPGTIGFYVNKAVLWIRIGFSADPAFFVNADPDTDPDPDPGF
jgi:hypothetical protein